MTFIHMANTAIAVIPVVVSLQDVLCSTSGSNTAEVTINARTIGDVTCRKNGLINTVFNWIDPTSAAPGDPLYQIKRGVQISGNVDLQSDSGFGPLANVWQDVGVLAFWGFVCTSGGFFQCTAQFEVSIRQGPSGPVLDTAIWSLVGTVF